MMQNVNRKNYNTRKQNNNQHYNRNNNQAYNLRYKQGNQNGNNYNLDISKQLLNYIYSSVEMSKYKYNMLKTEDDLHMLDVQKYKVSPNYNGINCLLLFVKIRDKKYSCLIDRRKLSYNLSQIDYDALKIINIRVALDETIYNGTIIDGTYITQNAKKKFIISDCYRFRGQNMTDEQLPIKLLNIKTYLELNYKPDNIINTIDLHINTVYNLDETEKLITNEIPKAKNMQVRGLVFHPILSGTKLIFLFNNSHTVTNDNNDKNNYTFIHKNNTIEKTSETKKNVSYVCKTDEDIFMTLQIKNTATVDVYKLYAVEQVDGSSIGKKKPIYKTKKLGIAYIPTIECSHMCRTLFIDDGSNSNTKKRVFVKCKFDKYKNKWTPVEQELNKQRPSTMEELEKYMDIIEDTDSDSD